MIEESKNIYTVLKLRMTFLLPVHIYISLREISYFILYNNDQLTIIHERTSWLWCRGLGVLCIDLRTLGGPFCKNRAFFSHFLGLKNLV